MSTNTQPEPLSNYDLTNLVIATAMQARAEGLGVKFANTQQGVAILLPGYNYHDGRLFPLVANAPAVVANQAAAVVANPEVEVVANGGTQ